MHAEVLAGRANNDDHMTPSAPAGWSVLRAVMFIVVDAEVTAADALASSTGEALQKVRVPHTDQLLARMKPVDDDEWSAWMPGEDEALDLP